MLSGLGSYKVKRVDVFVPTIRIVSLTTLSIIHYNSFSYIFLTYICLLFPCQLKIDVKPYTFIHLSYFLLYLFFSKSFIFLFVLSFYRVFSPFTIKFFLYESSQLTSSLLSLIIVRKNKLPIFFHKKILSQNSCHSPFSTYVPKF